MSVYSLFLAQCEKQLYAVSLFARICIRIQKSFQRAVSLRWAVSIHLHICTQCHLEKNCDLLHVAIHLQNFRVWMHIHIPYTPGMGLCIHTLPLENGIVYTYPPSGERDCVYIPSLWRMGLCIHTLPLENGIVYTYPPSGEPHALETWGKNKTGAVDRIGGDRINFYIPSCPYHMDAIRIKWQYLGQCIHGPGHPWYRNEHPSDVILMSSFFF